jgi:hypothetical protein
VLLHFQLQASDTGPELRSLSSIDRAMQAQAAMRVTKKKKNASGIPEVCSLAALL